MGPTQIPYGFPKAERKVFEGKTQRERYPSVLRVWQIECLMSLSKIALSVMTSWILQMMQVQNSTAMVLPCCCYYRYQFQLVGPGSKASSMAPGFRMT